MGTETGLEQRIQQLIDAYQEQCVTCQRLELENEEQTQQIQELENICLKLRSRVDEMDRDRFTLKRLRDERKSLRRKLEAVLARLAALEEELQS